MVVLGFSSIGSIQAIIQLVMSITLIDSACLTCAFLLLQKIAYTSICPQVKGNSMIYKIVAKFLKILKFLLQYLSYKNPKSE